MLCKEVVVFVHLFICLITKTTPTPLNPDRLFGITDALFFYKEHLLKYYFDKHLHIHKHHHHYHHRIPNYNDFQNNEIQQELLEEYTHLGDSDKQILLEELSQEFQHEQNQNELENVVETPSLEEIDKIILESLKQSIFATNTTPSNLATQETTKISNDNNQTNNLTKTQNTYEVYEDIKE